MFFVPGVVLFFCSLACLIINNIVRFSKFFFLVVLLALQLPSYPFSPPCGLGVRGAPPWHLLFGSFSASFVFMDPFRFMMGNANCY
jgi:hypothetical protein